MNNQYQGLFARFYDLIQYECFELPAYLDFMKRYGNKILELGCGTGRLTIPLAQNGAIITGIDLNNDMLDICRRKIPESISIKLINGDITDYFIDETFDLIIAPCNVINHLLSLEQVNMMINCSKKHLKPGGRLIIDNSVPPLKEMIVNNGKLEILEFLDKTSGTIIKDYYLPSYDFINNLEYDNIKLEEYKDNVIINHEEIEETMAFYYARELRYLITQNKFKIEKEIGSLRKGTPLNIKSREMVFICRKEEEKET